MSSQPAVVGDEKNYAKEPAVNSQHDSYDGSHDEEVGAVSKGQPLQRNLQNRHMQMIAIGGAIGAGLFVGSGGALRSGGPAALVIGYMIVGIMLMFTTQALAEMAVLYPVNGAFYTYNGFNGFAGVFVVAAFAFGGTELVGLAAAESANPRKAIPMASKQVFWRIAFFYIVNLFILGLIVPANDPRLMGSSGANTKASPFVLAIQDAGIKVLPSIFNAVITIAVISVANSCTFGSTRTMQAMAERGMAPRFLAYVDKHGRPIWCVLIQIAFGLLAFIGESADSSTVFAWLLALSGLSYFFVWGSICLSHIRMRMAWKVQGYTLDQIPYKVPLGIWGSAIGLFLNVLCLIATFYNALYPSPNAQPEAEAFFTAYLAAPIVIFLYILWKLISRDWRLYVPLRDIDLKTGVVLADPSDEPEPEKTWANLPRRMARALF
ncbi:amino-acid permease inda1 [Colletotrichum tofieldiae]|nr:amino-acid permease inda1 [Colletotrichum tofieldiae]GKT73387.1 amino-acid permease inda1 [Colletotrichum tofieldiae]